MITKSTQRIIDAAKAAGIEANTYQVSETLTEVIFVKRGEAAKLMQELRPSTGRYSNFATGPRGAISVHALIRWITDAD